MIPEFKVGQIYQCVYNNYEKPFNIIIKVIEENENSFLFTDIRCPLGQSITGVYELSMRELTDNYSNYKLISLKENPEYFL